MFHIKQSPFVQKYKKLIDIEHITTDIQKWQEENIKFF